MTARFPRGRFATAFVLALLGSACAAAATRPATAPGEDGQPLRIEGTVVLVEPNIELSLITAGGLLEPREAWSRDARRFYAEAVRTHLAAANTPQAPDFDVPDDLEPDSRLGQVVRLNEAVALSISQFLLPGGALATKRDAAGQPRLDWTLGEGVVELRAASGADYALFTYVRDSYASGGRTALRVFGVIAGAAMGTGLDIGGGRQHGVATLVDLRTGKVVWFNQLARQSGDLRERDEARKSVDRLLEGLPL
ncbi:hypothetical protein [Silanimonas sp.]|uniref:hypothetical protein n=1 Tax=Silanimonas sp. TaxID=1929290 RepID=UPI0022C78427|nr:hypothetical protein [Silanimonas sp.]MCZ8064318.1 hypothetical protein [Silanimonas sp.]